MATQITKTLIDDLDGTPASETFRFAVQGVNYEIDLSTKNAEEFKQRLDTYASAGRRLKGGSMRKQASAGSSVSDGPSMKDVRAWAASQGLSVKPMGRLSDDIIAQYIAAQ